MFRRRDPAHAQTPSVLDMLILLRQQIFAQSLDQPLFSFEPFDNDSTDVDKPQTSSDSRYSGHSGCLNLL